MKNNGSDCGTPINTNNSKDLTVCGVGGPGGVSHGVMLWIWEGLLLTEMLDCKQGEEEQESSIHHCSLFLGRRDVTNSLKLLPS